MNVVSTLARALRGSQMMHEDERFSIRLKEADYTNDRLERRIMELADSRSVAEVLRRLTVSTLVQMFTPDPVGGGATQQVVYRVKGADQVKDTWQRRIIDLADGKSIDELLDTVFSQEIRAGAWVVDIGIWRNLFDQSVVKTIGELADQGYICLEPSIKEE